MYLGIEIGGTKLQLGLGAGDGTLSAIWRGSVDVGSGAEGIRRQIATEIPKLLAGAGQKGESIRAAGIGFGGPIDDQTRIILKSHQIEGWENYPLAAWAEELLGVPVAIGNDADVAGLGESLFGAGRGFSPIFYITIGSGIGGGLIVGGEIYRGTGRGAAEIGHLRLMTPQGPTILEHLASGWAIDRAGGRPAVETAAAAANGDIKALSILDAAWSDLAEGICHVIALVCPRRIVIGGGVSRIGEDLLFRPLRDKVAERVFRPFVDCYDIVPAELAEDVVVHGALALARRR